MRRLSLRLGTGIVFFAAVGAAAILGLAGSGRAASPNICATSSNLTADPPVYASCVTDLVLPHKVNVGSDAQSVMAFRNEGGSSASHVSLQSAFSSAVTVQAIRLLKNGVDQGTGSCTPSTFPATNVTLVSCSDFSNFAGGDRGKLVVRFTSATAGTVTVTSTALYAESGSDNTGGPNGTKNDRQTGRPDSVEFVPVGEPASGGCTDGAGSFSDGNTAQFTSVTYSATTDTSLLCTPASAGVDPTPVPGLQTAVSFVELIAQGGPGYATVNIDFTPLPSNTTIKKLELKEALPPLFDFSTFIVVPACQSNGLPPNAGTPPAAGPPQVNDACVFDRVNLPRGGGRLVLHVIGGLLDPRFGG